MGMFLKSRPLDKGAYLKIYFLFLNQNICCLNETEHAGF